MVYSLPAKNQPMSIFNNHVFTPKKSIYVVLLFKLNIPLLRHNLHNTNIELAYRNILFFKKYDRDRHTERHFWRAYQTRR